MRPDYRILVGQQDVTSTARDRLISLSLTDESGYESDTATLRLDDRDSAIELPQKGAGLEVFLGYRDEGLARIGLYIVDDVELAGPPDTVTVRAHAVDVLSGLKAHKTRHWPLTTINAIVGTIASEHGLTPRVSSGLGAIRIPHIDQTEESDMSFLTRLGGRYDAVAKAAGNYLLFVPTGQAQAASGRPAGSASIRRSQVSAYSATLADREAYGAVSAHWQDVATGQRVEVLAGSGEPVFTLRDPYPTDAEARAAAQAKLRVLTRGLATVSLTVKPGIPTLAAEIRLTLSDFRSGYPTDLVVMRATHTLDGSGFRTQVEAETPSD